jgi:catechol 2,3-dioxygenase-like lactoylglutathione lyase family enzyme
MILDHMGLTVSDADASKAFFTAALKPLRIALVTETHGWMGFGRDGRPQFWFGGGAQVQHPMHLAFAAENREQVRAFHAAALAAGAQDNGPPGLRAHYHPHYYGAFVIGPDGHNIEAVCHAPAP